MAGEVSQGAHQADSLVEALVEAAGDLGKEMVKKSLNLKWKADMIFAFEGVVCILWYVLNQQHGFWPGLT